MPDSSYAGAIGKTAFPDLAASEKKAKTALDEATDAEGKVAADKSAMIADAEKPGGALSPPEIEPYKPPPESNPWKAFGSPAMWIAAAGGLLTRRSLTTSLEAGGKVMEAMKANDLEAAKQHYEAWKANTDNALKLQDYKLKVFDEILGAKDLSAAEKLARAKTAVTQLGLDEGLARDIDTFTQHVEAEKKGRVELEKASLEITEIKNKMQAQADYAAAVKSGDPAAVEEALQRRAEYEPAIAAQIKPSYSNPATVEVADGKGGTKTMLAQQDKRTGRWVSADEDRTPLPKVKSIAGKDTSDAVLTGFTLDYAAEQYRHSGKLPPMGLGSTGAAAQNRANLIKRAAELSEMERTGALPEGAIAGDRDLGGQYAISADKSSLASLTKMTDAAVSFENTAAKNFDLAVSLFPKGSSPDMGPWVNKWVLTGETGAGSKDVPPYVTALLTGANEYAKIMSGSTGAQGSTVDSRKEAADRFSPYLDKGQIEGVIKVAKQDMDNRKASLRDQLDDIRARITGGERGGAENEAGGDKGGAGDELPPAAKSQLKEGQVTIFANGQAWTLENGVAKKVPH